MDFVQRNLINERNNLQIELAKAKLLIAELSEGKIKIPFTNKSISWGKEGELLKQADAKLAELRKQQDSAAKSPPKDSRAWPIGEYSYPDSAGTKNEVNEQAEYISDLENVIIAIAESMNVSATDLYETYRITPVRRDLLNKIQGTAFRDASDAVGPDGEDYRASSLKKHDRAMSRSSRIELIKMMALPPDKRKFEQHPTLRYFPDDRDPKDLKDKAIKSDLKAERVREISNRPKKKKTS